VLSSYAPVLLDADLYLPTDEVLDGVGSGIKAGGVNIGVTARPNLVTAFSAVLTFGVIPLLALLLLLLSLPLSMTGPGVTFDGSVFFEPLLPPFGAVVTGVLVTALNRAVSDKFFRTAFGSLDLVRMLDFSKLEECELAVSSSSPSPFASLSSSSSNESFSFAFVFPLDDDLDEGAAVVEILAEAEAEEGAAVHSVEAEEITETFFFVVDVVVDFDFEVFCETDSFRFDDATLTMRS